MPTPAPLLPSSFSTGRPRAVNAYQRVLRALGCSVPPSRPGAAFWRLATYLEGRSINVPTHPSYELGPLRHYVAPQSAWPSTKLLLLKAGGVIYTVDQVAAFLWHLGHLKIDGERRFRRTARWLCAARAATEPGSDERKFVKRAYCQGLGQMAQRGYGAQYTELQNLTQDRLQSAAETVCTVGGVVLFSGKVDTLAFWLPCGIPNPLRIADQPGSWHERAEPC